MKKDKPPFNIVFEGALDKKKKCQYAIEYKSTNYLSVFINGKIAMWFAKEDVKSGKQFVKAIRKGLRRLERG